MPEDGEEQTSKLIDWRGGRAILAHIHPSSPIFPEGLPAPLPSLTATVVSVYSDPYSVPSVLGQLLMHRVSVRSPPESTACEESNGICGRIDDHGERFYQEDAGCSTGYIRAAKEVKR